MDEHRVAVQWQKSGATTRVGIVVGVANELDSWAKGLRIILASEGMKGRGNMNIPRGDEIRFGRIIQSALAKSSVTPSAQKGATLIPIRLLDEKPTWKLKYYGLKASDGALVSYYYASCLEMPMLNEVYCQDAGVLSEVEIRNHAWYNHLEEVLRSPTSLSEEFFAFFGLPAKVTAHQNSIVLSYRGNSGKDLEKAVSLSEYRQWFGRNDAQSVG
jgi:hypothetical protein